MLISCATVIVGAGGSIWLNPFATVLIVVCSTVIVEFCTRVAWMCLVYFLLCKEEDSYPVSAIIERRGMGLYEVPLFSSLLGVCYC